MTGKYIQSEVSQSGIIVQHYIYIYIYIYIKKNRQIHRCTLIELDNHRLDRSPFE